MIRIESYSAKNIFLPTPDYNYQARNSSNNNPSYPPPLPSGNVSKRQRSPSPDYREDRVPIEHGSYDKNARVRKEASPSYPPTHYPHDSIDRKSSFDHQEFRKDNRGPPPARRDSSAGAEKVNYSGKTLRDVLGTIASCCCSEEGSRFIQRSIKEGSDDPSFISMIGNLGTILQKLVEDCPTTPKIVDTTDEFMAKITPFVIENVSSVDFLQNANDILKNTLVHSPLPSRIDICGVLSPSMYDHAHVFNLNNSGRQCFEIVKILNVFEGASDSVAQPNASEKNVLVSSIPITGKLWKRLGQLLPLTVGLFSLSYSYNNFSGYTEGSKRPNETIHYNNDFLISKGEHKDANISDARKELVEKLPNYNVQQYGKIRFLPVYAAAISSFEFYLLDVQKRRYTLLISGDVTNTKVRAELVRVSINIFRYFLTLREWNAFPEYAIPLFKEVNNIEYCKDHVAKNRTPKDTCPDQLYDFLKDGLIACAVQVKCTGWQGQRLKITPVGLRISRTADLVTGWRELLIAVKCILTCLASLHEKGFCHRDLRWPNIIKLLKSDGDATFKVIDFELSNFNGETANFAHPEVCPPGSPFVYSHDLLCLKRMVVVWQNLGLDGPPNVNCWDDFLSKLSEEAQQGTARQLLGHLIFQDILI